MSTELTTPIKIEIPGIGTIESADLYLKYEADKVMAHQKYKRCMAMAEWCDTKADWYYGIGEFFMDRVEFYIKWRDRWLKLAEMFK